MCPVPGWTQVVVEWWRRVIILIERPKEKRPHNFQSEKNRTPTESRTLLSVGHLRPCADDTTSQFKISFYFHHCRRVELNKKENNKKKKKETSCIALLSHKIMLIFFFFFFFRVCPVFLYVRERAPSDSKKRIICFKQRRKRHAKINQPNVNKPAGRQNGEIRFFFSNSGLSTF